MLNYWLNMNILYDNIIYSYSKHGGVARYWQELTKRIECIANVIYSDAPRKKYYPYALNLLKKVNIDNIDCKSIFHSSYYRIPNHKCYNVVTLHDFTIDLYGDYINKFYHRIYKYKSLRSADHIICVSNNTRSDLLNLIDIDSSKISVIYHGVSNEFYSNNIDINVNSNYLLYVGNRCGYKNFKLAVDSISILKDFKLMIVGGGSLTNDERLHLDLKIKNRWKFIGKCSDYELKKYYTDACGLLYTSNYEGFGMPILESMAAGCPVLCQKKSALNEVGGSAALYVENDPYSVIDKIYLLSNLDYRTEVIRKGIVNAKNFNWDKTAYETLQVYKKFY